MKDRTHLRRRLVVELDAALHGVPMRTPSASVARWDQLIAEVAALRVENARLTAVRELATRLASRG